MSRFSPEKNHLEPGRIGTDRKKSRTSGVIVLTNQQTDEGQQKQNLLGGNSYVTWGVGFCVDGAMLAVSSLHAMLG